MIVSYGVEVKKMMDSRGGRLLLPPDWRQAEVGPTRQLYVVKRSGYLKVIPYQATDEERRGGRVTETGDTRSW